MRRYGIALGLAAFCAAATVSAQQQPPASATPQPPATQTASADRSSGATVTLTGCVYKEQDVPGRTPNVAERAGVLEDYILAHVESKSSPESGTVGTSGSADAGKKMYKLEQIADDRLQALVGKRVEVTGRIDAEPGDAGRPTGTSGAAQPDRSAGPDRIEMPEFEVASIKAVEGTCPASPAAK
jgi:hypothetical protein